MCSFLQPLLRFLPDDQGPSPWMDKPVLSTIRWWGWLPDVSRFNMGFRRLLLLDNVVWSGTGKLRFISLNKDMTKPSVCLSGRWKRIRNERMVSMAKLEYFWRLPGLFAFGGFHDLRADGDIQRVRLPRFLGIDASWWLCTDVCTLGCDFSYGILSLWTPAMSGIYTIGIVMHQRPFVE